MHGACNIQRHETIENKWIWRPPKCRVQARQMATDASTARICEKGVFYLKSNRFHAQRRMSSTMPSPSPSLFVIVELYYIDKTASLLAQPRHTHMQSHIIFFSFYFTHESRDLCQKKKRRYTRRRRTHTYEKCTHVPHLKIDRKQRPNIMLFFLFIFLSFLLLSSMRDQQIRLTHNPIYSNWVFNESKTNSWLVARHLSIPHTCHYVSPVES